ncbi:hypothetical protein BBOV_I003375 [Babesia bovis T2Bo]|uniref:hypothetical protein n=1 Tax=Babesia bovis T2Bo TaxID=484906 RepID=UPI001C356ED1|nr:hypothetical protein BBOV_I003375 [Babesia bovis T2Bo]KAG6440205.1 hypothetical protein BBOV_I003375 [Babesia bovis T2Bo]
MDPFKIILCALAARVCCLAVKTTSRSEVREKFSEEDLPPHSKDIDNTTEAERERLEKLYSFLEKSGIDTDKAEELDDQGQALLTRIKALVGDSNAKAIAVIASIAADIGKRAGNKLEDSPEKSTTYLLEQIASTIEAQGGKFDYGKIGEALHKWVATLVPTGSGHSDEL